MQNQFTPPWQQQRLEATRNRCNSDIDLVTCGNATVVTYSRGDQLDMHFNHIAMAQWTGGGVGPFLRSFFPPPRSQTRAFALAHNEDV